MGFCEISLEPGIVISVVISQDRLRPSGLPRAHNEGKYSRHSTGDFAISILHKVMCACVDGHCHARDSLLLWRAVVISKRGRSLSFAPHLGASRRKPQTWESPSN